MSKFKKGQIVKIINLSGKYIDDIFTNDKYRVKDNSINQDLLKWVTGQIGTMITDGTCPFVKLMHPVYGEVVGHFYERELELVSNGKMAQGLQIHSIIEKQTVSNYSPESNVQQDKQDPHFDSLDFFRNRTGGKITGL